MRVVRFPLNEFFRKCWTEKKKIFHCNWFGKANLRVIRARIIRVSSYQGLRHQSFELPGVRLIGFPSYQKIELSKDRVFSKNVFIKILRILEDC